MASGSGWGVVLKINSKSFYSLTNQPVNCGSAIFDNNAKDNPLSATLIGQSWRVSEVEVIAMRNYQFHFLTSNNACGSIG